MLLASLANAARSCQQSDQQALRSLIARIDRDQCPRMHESRLDVVAVRVGQLGEHPTPHRANRLAFRHQPVLEARAVRQVDSFEELAFEPRPQWTTLAAKEDPQDRSERLELARALSIALARLQEEQRLVVILSDVQGYSYDEIASITGISLGTVKSRLSRGRGRLREILREFPGGAELFARYRRRYEEGAEG